MAGAGGQSWLGGVKSLPQVRGDTALPSPGSKAAPAPPPGDPLLAEARGEPRWGLPAGTGGRWPPHSSWRGCRRSAMGDARESSRERLRHRAVRAGGTPRGRGGRAELPRTESRRDRGATPLRGIGPAAFGDPVGTSSPSRVSGPSRGLPSSSSRCEAVCPLRVSPPRVPRLLKGLSLSWVGDAVSGTPGAGRGGHLEAAQN